MVNIIFLVSKEVKHRSKNPNIFYFVTVILISIISETAIFSPSLLLAQEQKPESALTNNLQGQLGLPVTPTLEAEKTSVKKEGATAQDKDNTNRTAKEHREREYLDLGDTFAAHKRWKEAEDAYKAALESESKDIRQKALKSLKEVVAKQEKFLSEQSSPWIVVQLQKAVDTVFFSVLIFVVFFVIWRISNLFQWQKRCLELVPVVDTTEEKFGLHFPAIFAFMLDKFRSQYGGLFSPGIPTRLFSPGPTLPLIVSGQEKKEMAQLISSLSSAPPAKILEWFLTNRKPEYRVEISLQDNHEQIEAVYSLYHRNKSILIEEQIFQKTDINLKQKEIAYKILTTISQNLEP